MSSKKITYTDKVTKVTSSLPNQQKVTSGDMNEIKTVVNSHADSIDTISNNVETINDDIDTINSNINNIASTKGTVVKLGSVAQENITLATTRNAVKSRVFVQMQDNWGNPIMVETDCTKVYYTKDDDSNMVDLKTLTDVMGKLISMCSFYDSKPASLLETLGNYIDLDTE